MSTASINDFKLLNIKCSKYYELFKKSNNLFAEPPTDKLKERFGSLSLYAREFVQ
ncbi:hypothetical protein [Aeromonas sp.]|uniref:hypothetical protein n=1 Tax=Aeromonas sp. TaxID=647 RepID=UPI002582DBB1|nr:hypothetical protein [Aeromonas sp.]MCX7133960.1 hypothetical protein [Aeromonas sp.]